MVWQTVQEALIEVFFGLMVTNCGWIPGCLSSLAISLIPFKPQIAIKNPRLKWESPEPLPEIHTRILNLLQKVKPTIGSQLSVIFQVHGLIPAIGNNFLRSLYAKQPFFMRNCESHCLYLTAVFGVLHRPLGDHLHRNLWSMVAQHLLDVDVNIHARDLEGVHLFQCDLEDEKPLKLDPISRQDTTLLTVMDSMMELTFEKLERHLTERNLDPMWELMLDLLDDLFISSYEAQFVHFLVFYLAQKKPQKWSASLVQRCLSKLGDGTLWVASRGVYATYAASFLARAKFAPLEVKIQFLEALLLICEDYARLYRTTDYDTPEQEPDILPDLSDSDLLTKHYVFFNYVQALLYLLCYLIPQHCQKQKQPNEHTHDRVERFQGVLIEMGCLVEGIDSVKIALQFSELTQRLGIINCHHLYYEPLLYGQRNKLSAHFPFDPYPLVRSSAYLNLEGSYLSWSEVTAELGDDEIEVDEEQQEGVIMEGLSLEDHFTPGSSLPFCGSGHSSLLSDGLN